MADSYLDPLVAARLVSIRCVAIEFYQYHLFRLFEAPCSQQYINIIQLDLFLHYDDLRTRHRFAFKGLTGYKFYRFIGQLIWTFIAAPCLALVWYLLGHELAPAPMPWTVALPVLTGVNVVAGIAFIFLLKLPALNGETLRLLMND